MLPELNSLAPDFALPDHIGKEHKLSTYRGSWVVIYFYPKDDTPGCTKEACGFRDNFHKFSGIKAYVFGISVDPVKSHQKFVEKYALPFTVLSDEAKVVVNAYGVWAKKKFMGREYDGILRTTFLINPEGHIAKIFEKVKPEGHAEEVLKFLSSLNL